MAGSTILLFLLASSPGDGPSIDSILEAAWKKRGLEPAAVCGDEEFLRRVSLDLIGRIPSLEEIARFQRQPRRGDKVEELLASPEFSRFWSEVWTANWNGYGNPFDSDREMLAAWVEESLNARRPYDWMVSRLITARGASGLDGPANFLVRHPEEPIVKVSRLFLGVRLDCARCHDHPYDRWTEEDFQLMSRFFALTRRREVSEGNIRLVDETPPADEERPRFLTGARPRTGRWRDELALFLVSSKPFARAYVNRVWYQLFGRGIVHPVDDFSRDNRAAVPELLELLADRARRDSFAIRPLIRLICGSRAYQLSTRHAEPTSVVDALFARHALKPLTPEQMIDSTAIALGLAVDSTGRRELIERMVGEALDEDFGSTWEYRETVRDLMVRLGASLPVPSGDIDELYSRLLSRGPTARERRLCEGRPRSEIVFALLNANEFYFNH